MKALVFRHSLAREAISAIGGHVDRRAYVAPFAPVRLTEVAELPLPAPDWVRVDTLFSGLCGSDVKQILLNGSRDNPLTALVSFPHVLGHEVVGHRTDTGERVVLNPWLSCGPRGIDPPCPACAAGRYPWCRNFRSGDLPTSIHLGNCAAAVGAHAERFAAHPSQLFPIPSDVSDEAAVLADPVSVSLRSVLLAPPPGGSPVLVYGSGTLAYAAIALLRHLYPDTEVWAATRPGARAELATRLGAHAVLPSVPDELVDSVARRIGTVPLSPWSKRDWLQDGPAVVYDTIGSTETVETSLRLLATGGTLVVSGVEPPKRFEWTPLYFKELRVIGSNGFGIETVHGVAKHAMEHYFDFAAAGLDLTPVITHRFPLDRWQEAVLALKDSRRTGAVKVLLEPRLAMASGRGGRGRRGGRGGRGLLGVTGALGRDGRAVVPGQPGRRDFQAFRCGLGCGLAGVLGRLPGEVLLGQGFGGVPGQVLARGFGQRPDGRVAVGGDASPADREVPAAADPRRHVLAAGPRRVRLDRGAVDHDQLEGEAGHHDDAHDADRDRRWIGHLVPH